ncbi:MAG: purine-nucleoside phosphorylase [Bacillota bacterium]|nr:purine-nucleoside phosphorylase [Bacillota bacterium]
MKFYNLAVSNIKRYIETEPEIGIVLGSGCGNLAKEAEIAVEIPFDDIPGFKPSTAPGHEGKLVFGKLSGKDVVLMNGRLHFYEGYSPLDIVFPIRVMRLLGVKTLILTNAAGGINPSFSPGNLMLITDHINFAFRNPLIGPNADEFGPRFPDMSDIYTPRLIELCKATADNLGISVKEGVYMWFSGPSYETPAEIKMARLLGADAVGMSTVPEAIAAHHAGMEILAISCITNMGTGISKYKLSHNDITKAAEKIQNDFSNLIKNTIKNL